MEVMTESLSAQAFIAASYILSGGFILGIAAFNHWQANRLQLIKDVIKSEEGSE